MSAIEQEVADGQEEKPTRKPSTRVTHLANPPVQFRIDYPPIVQSVEDIEQGNKVTRRIFFGITAATTLATVTATIGISRWEKIKDYLDGKTHLSEVFKINW